jgi:hypothetical protein
VRDAEGLHPVVFDDQTEVHRAVGAPTYDLAPPAVARRFRTGDELWIAGKPSADGSLHAVHIDVNFVAFAGGIAAAAGPRHVDARLQIRKSLQFEPQITRLQLAPSGRILKLDATGRYVPARLDELNLGQYIGMNGYRAEDGSLVVTTLLLGNGKSPGQA